MSDLIKTVLAVLITGVLSSVTTTQVLKTEITYVKSSLVSVKNSVEKLDDSVNEKINRLDERVLDTQLKQAQYLAAN